jgi:hypothetical protein
MAQLLQQAGGTSVLALLTIWLAVAALAALVFQTLGAAKLKQFPVTAGVVVVALLAVPAGGILKVAKPVAARIRPYIRHTESPAIAAATTAAGASGCPVFPADNVWNASVRSLPLASDSANFIQSMGPDAGVHADFGPRAGYEFAVVKDDIPPANVMLTDYAGESDPGPYRIPDNAPLEAGSDHHVLTIDEFHCQLYELFGAQHQGPGSWTAASGAIFDLRSNKMRHADWTSADAAGLPVLPGLVRYDEVKAGRIGHALRFTTPSTRNVYVWPARHKASNKTDPALPPMGQRFRLRASFDLTSFSPEARVILAALQEYGMFLADNGSKWFLSGAMDSRWPSEIVEELRQVHGSDFEAVDSSPMMVDPDSAQVKR